MKEKRTRGGFHVSDSVRLFCMHLFFGILLLVAFRHLILPGDHLWTGEGARASWSMRLRGKVCKYAFKTAADAKWESPDFSALTPSQAANLDDPLFLLQFVQQTLCTKHKAVYATVWCRSISHQPALLIDREKDLCQATYSPVSHNEWITLRPGYWDQDYAAWFQATWGRNIQ